MLIVCPSCATSYNVELATLSPEGRQVRCARCRNVWHAELSQADKLLAAAAAIAPMAAPAAAEAVPAAAAPSAESNPATELSADAGAGETAPAEPAAEAVDAGNQPAEVDAPPIVPSDPDDGAAPIEVAANDSAALAHEPAAVIETVAARRRRRGAKNRRPRWPLSRMQTGILALALINVVLVGWRSDVVRALPQTASFYALLGLPVNLRGLTFDNIVSTVEQHDGVPILVIEGNVFNGSRKAEDVPRLKLILRNAARQEIYSWMAAPTHAVLQSGEAETFRARLASPPPDAHDLILRFVNRRDILAGIH